MRTTLNIADDVLMAVKERARREKRSAGEVLSDLARSALVGAHRSDEVAEPTEFCGFRPFPHRGAIVTNALVQKLLDEDPD